MTFCRTTLPLLTVVAAALMAGCTNPSAKYVGHYNGKITFGGDLTAKVAAGGTAAIQLLNSMRTTLDLRDDKTYTSTTTDSDESKVETGKWILADKVVTLTPDPNQPGNGPTNLTVNADGTLTGSDNQTSVTFTKA